MQSNAAWKEEMASLTLTLTLTLTLDDGMMVWKRERNWGGDHAERSVLWEVFKEIFFVIQLENGGGF